MVVLVESTVFHISQNLPQVLNPVQIWWLMVSIQTERRIHKYTEAKHIQVSQKRNALSVIFELEHLLWYLVHPTSQDSHFPSQSNTI